MYLLKDSTHLTGVRSFLIMSPCDPLCEAQCHKNSMSVEKKSVLYCHLNLAKNVNVTNENSLRCACSSMAIKLLSYNKGHIVLSSHSSLICKFNV